MSYQLPPMRYNYNMPKPQTRFVCQQCGRTTPRAMGRCPACGAWNSMVEEIVSAPAPSAAAHAAQPGRGLTSRSRPVRLDEIEGDVEDRLPVPISEFARVLGGGVVPGSIVLVGGDPGIGKSTLLLQLAMEMAKERRVLYVSGEESERQIKMRALRLNGVREEALPANLLLVTETNLDIIFEHVQGTLPHILIVDSIQTVYIPELESTAGSVGQVRECANRLREVAKSSGMAVFLIGHVTKEGMIAGPRVLEHIVDTVLYLEGDRYQSFRLLRSVKNRFGATSEVGVFEMQERGMVEVLNPSEAFLAERMVNVPGSAIAVTMEGTRPLLVELQGLTSPSNLGNPRRTPNGLDVNRLLHHRRRAHPPPGFAPGRAGRVRQRGRRPAHHRAFCGPGRGRGDRFFHARYARARRYRADRRGGLIRRAALGGADDQPPARSRQIRFQIRHCPAPHPAR